jgi:NAD(P)H-hydrate epimerase
MNAIQNALYTSATVRGIDRHAIDRLGIAGYELMTRAGREAFGLIRECWPAARRLVVICGGGNNGGDGYVVARLARESLLDVFVVPLANPHDLRGDARTAYDDYARSGGTVTPWRNDLLTSADLIVDAIFGTGLSRPLDAPAHEKVDAVNASGKPVLAIDVPSGLSADTGEVLGAAIRATRTITFVGRKAGFHLAEAPDYVGVVTFASLAIHGEAYASAEPVAYLLTESMLREILPPRAKTSHKGSNGHVLIIGGGAAMGGAVCLAGEASLRAGAGLVTVATHPNNVSSIVAVRPELICRGIASPAELSPLIEKADVIALGPGLGQDDWAQAIYSAAFEHDLPMIVDADGLNLLAKNARRQEHWVLTPHPGEAGRLLGISTADVQRRRLDASAQLAETYGGTIVLKGASTIVRSRGETPSVCPFGNPGMASPGMGDVLTGVIAGLAAQIGRLDVAARAGVLVHALAGDWAARNGERGMIASDLFDGIRRCVNP